MGKIMIKRPKNTKKEGCVEFLYFKEKNTYVGVCLTFDIIEEGKSLSKLKESLEEAAKLHLKVVIKKDLSNDLLNRYAPQKYWNLYFKHLRQLSKAEISRKKDNATSFEYSPYSFLKNNIACAF